MSKHGRGPKVVLVRRYLRWRFGKLEWVRETLRSNSPQAPQGDLKAQLTLGLQPAS